MNLKIQLKKTMDERGISFPVLAKKLGIPAARMYKWYQQGTNPKPEDALIIEKWINDNKDMDLESNPVPADYLATLGVLYEKVIDLLAARDNVSTLTIRLQLEKEIQRLKEVRF